LYPIKTHVHQSHTRTPKTMNKTMETKEIILVTYPNGHTEAYYRHDPALLELFICEHDIIEDVIVAELKQPKEEK